MGRVTLTVLLLGLLLGASAAQGGQINLLFYYDFGDRVSDFGGDLVNVGPEDLGWFQFYRLPEGVQSSRLKLLRIDVPNRFPACERTLTPVRSTG